MSEFVTPERKIVSDKEYIESLINANLVKDLNEDEEICQYCHGTGMMVADNVYGLDGDTTTRELFPYKHQSISFCNHCYNGIVRKCKYCGEILDRATDYYNHHCAGYDAEKEREEVEKDKEVLEKSIETPADEFDVSYSEDYMSNDGYFTDWDEFFDDWASNHEENDEKPEFVFGTVSENMVLDAYDLCSNATENMYDEAMDQISSEDISKLQSVLNQWIEDCGPGPAYCVDYSRKVRIPWSEY